MSNKVHEIPEESIDTTEVPVNNYLNVQERML